MALGVMSIDLQQVLQSQTQHCSVASRVQHLCCNVDNISVEKLMPHFLLHQEATLFFTGYFSLHNSWTITDF